MIHDDTMGRTQSAALLRNLWRVTLLPVALLLGACASVEPAAEGPRYPVPAHVSPEAQAVLARPVNLAGALAAVPSTAEEWRAQREATEARIFRPMIQLTVPEIVDMHLPVKATPTVRHVSFSSSPFNE